MYQALYRKWRPRTFDDVIGQPHITETLKNQVSTGRTSHAYLFIGTRGTGKTTCAKILAKAVNCEHPVDGNPCNACRVCRGIDDGSILDVVEMDAASNNGVDNVRQLRDEAIFSPATAKKRVYIIDEVHMLSLSAFNALLKILEEPPEHLMFILATTELSKVPATILSRCQRHSFRRLDVESIVERLAYVAAQEGITLTPDAAKMLAVRSEGGMRDALSMLDQCAGREIVDAETVTSALGLAGSREIAALLRHIAQRDAGAALAAFDRLWQNGKDPATLLGELGALVRDLLLDAVAPKSGRALRSGSYDDDILDAFRGVFPAEGLISMLETVQAAVGEMRSGQARMRCELCLVTLCTPECGDDLSALRARVAALEQRVQSGAAVPAPTPAPPAPAVTPTPAPPAPAPEAPASAPAAPSAPSAPPTPAPPAAADGGELWARIVPRLGEKFPMGTVMLLTDPTQVRAGARGGVLTLALQNDFASTMLDHPDVLADLSALATEVAGSPVRAVVGALDAPDAAAPARDPAEINAKLDALKKFDIVTIQ